MAREAGHPLEWRFFTSNISEARKDAILVYTIVVCEIGYLWGVSREI